MKKWSLIVAALYGLVLVVVFIPVTAIAFVKKGELNLNLPTELLREWGFWLTIAVLVIAQFALLRLPVAEASRRPQQQRSLWSTVLAAAFAMGLLVYGAGLSIWELVSRLEESKGSDTGCWVALGIGLASWAAWSIYFHRSIAGVAPAMQTRRLQRHLWTGSILELLVAIPIHIVARHRDYCCAGALTFIGLTCGISVMLFAFGPAVYFLFVERWKRLHPKD
jgi:hypothetical protein